jgi:methionyl-tRNA synthetase
MAETECELFQSRVLLRVAKITEVKRHPNADKLYIETISVGDEERVIVSGLVPYYSKEDLEGKHIILAANLKPAKLRGVESNGMLLAAEAGGIVEVIYVDEASPGDRITLKGYEESVTESPGEITIEEFFNIPIKVKDHHLYVGDTLLVSKSGPVKTVKVKDGKVT